MASVDIIFKSKNLVQAAKMQEQFVKQMEPLGYVLNNIEIQPISENNIETKITLVIKKKKKTP